MLRDATPADLDEICALPCELADCERPVHASLDARPVTGWITYRSTRG